MTNEVPWYVNEVPTVFVSLNFTTHLTDVPMVKAYINAYQDDRHYNQTTLTKSWVNQNSKELRTNTFGVKNGKSRDFNVD